jgi:hypothetical protein
MPLKQSLKRQARTFSNPDFFNTIGPLRPHCETGVMKSPLAARV